MAALMLPVLIGFTALALDGGYAFEVRKRVQAAADAGALAGAYAIENNPSIGIGEITNIVRADAAGNGFLHGTNGVTVDVFQAPTTANGFQYSYSGDTSAVGVTITQPTNSFFMQVLGSVSSLSIVARAVANSGADDNTNIVVLATGGNNCPNSAVSGDALLAGGGGNIAVAGSITVNSTNPGCAAKTSGVSASIIANAGVYVVGGIDNGGGPIAPAFTGAPPVPDPLSHLVFPSSVTGVGSCPAPPGACTPGYYGSGLNPNNQNLSPGEYLVDGGVNFNGTVVGNGVIIYLKTGHWELHNSGDDVTLTPYFTAATDPLRGVIIFQDRGNGEDAIVNANAIIRFTGIVYMHNLGCADPATSPCAGLILWANAGQPTGAPYSVFILDTMHLHGGGLIINNNFSGLPGGSILQKVALAE